MVCVSCVIVKILPIFCNKKSPDTCADHLASEHRIRDNQRECKKECFLMVVQEIEKCLKNLISMWSNGIQCLDMLNNSFAFCAIL